MSLLADKPMVNRLYTCTLDSLQLFNTAIFEAYSAAGKIYSHQQMTNQKNMPSALLSLTPRERLYVLTH